MNSPIGLKNIFDFCLAILLAIIGIPLFIAIAITIKIFSKGPVFFVQKRCGLNGRIFSLFKFRTMVDGAEKIKVHLEQFNEADGPVFKIKADPRIIPYLGTFLRKTGLDELPQLFNVIKGDMSLVGPRPPIPKEVNKYDVWQRKRLTMKPGITCLWQCSNKRNDIAFREWINLDLAYIDSWSLKLDCKILVKTVYIMFTGQGR